MLREQLLRLIELARRPNITIQLLPFDANAYAAFCGPFLHVMPAVRELGTVVIDQPAAGMACLRDDEDLETYRTMFHELVQQALPPIDPSAAPESRARRDSLGLVQHLLYARQEGAMTVSHWQKSTYSTGEAQNCVHLAAVPDGTVRLRESDEPDVVIAATATALGALIRAARQGGLDSPAPAPGRRGPGPSGVVSPSPPAPPGR